MAGGPKLIVAGYETGKARPHELTATLQEVWNDLIADDETRARIGALLAVDPLVVSQMKVAPVTIIPRRAGLTAGEAALIVVAWFGSEVILKSFGDIARDILKARLSRLWSETLEPALRKRTSRNALGRQLKLPLE